MPRLLLVLAIALAAMACGPAQPVRVAPRPSMRPRQSPIVPAAAPVARCVEEDAAAAALPESLIVERVLPECPPRPPGPRRSRTICLESLHPDGPHVLSRLFSDGRQETIDGGYGQPYVRWATGLPDGRLRYVRTSYQPSGALAGQSVWRRHALPPREGYDLEAVDGQFGNIDLSTLAAISDDGLLFAYLESRQPSTGRGPWDLVVQNLLHGERLRVDVGGAEWEAGLHFFGTAAPARARFDGTRVVIAITTSDTEMRVEQHDLSHASGSTLLDARTVQGELEDLSGDLRVALVARPRLGPSGGVDHDLLRLDAPAPASEHLPLDARALALDRCGDRLVVAGRVALGPPLFAHVNPQPFEVGRIDLAARRYERLLALDCAPSLEVTPSGLVVAICPPQDEQTPGTAWVIRLTGGEAKRFVLPRDVERVTVAPGW